MAQELLNALAATLSSDAEQRRPAELQLKNWESSPGFFESLLQIVSLHAQLPVQVRIQAALTFKNGLDKWRKTNPNAIPFESKAALRQQLLQLLDEENPTIATALALSIGKIARVDYETDWPLLPDELLQLIGSSLQDPARQLLLHRSLMATKRVVKSLVENRMPRGRKLMQKIGPILFAPLSKLYADYYNATINTLANITPSSHQECLFQLMVLHLLSRTLHYIFAHGWLDVAREIEPQTWLRSTLGHATQLLQLRTSLAARRDSSLSPILERLTNQLTAYGKLYKDQHRKGDVSRPVFEHCWTLVSQAGQTPESISEGADGLHPRSLVVQSMTTIRNVLVLWPSSEIDSKVPMSESEHAFHEQLKLWSRECAMLLVSKLIPMQDEELETWSEDPEGWLNEEEADRDDIDTRPAAIRLLESLLSQFRSVVAPALIGMLNSESMKRPANKQDVLVKEALYCALGRNPTNILDSLATYKPFSAWLSEDLRTELMCSDPKSVDAAQPCVADFFDTSYRIVKRRIVWLLGGWVGEELDGQTKAEIYQLLLHFLRPSPDIDIAIRLTAARAFIRGDSWGFSESVFAPYFEEVVSLLLGLMEEVQTIDSRIALTQTLGTLIERMGNAIAPFADTVMQMLPSLWASAGDQNQFKVTILTTVSNLAEAVGPQSASIQSPLCALISYGINPEMDDYAFLHEEAIALWRITLRFAPQLTPELTSLLPHLMHLLQAGTDTLPHALKIFEGYLLLDPHGVTQSYALPFFAALNTILSPDVRTDSVKLILHSFNMIITLAPSSIWHSPLEASNCFNQLVLPFSTTDDTLALSKYLCSLSRVAVSDVNAFHALVQSTAQKLSTPAPTLLDALLTAWTDLMDNIGSARHRKIAALAMSYLTATSDALILSRLANFAGIWCSVLAETEETEGGDAVAYSLLDAYDSEGEYETQTSLEYDRRMQARNMDPAHSQNLSSVISSNLNRAQELNGGAAAFHAGYLASIDPLILDELQRRLAGQLKG